MPRMKVVDKLITNNSLLLFNKGIKRCFRLIAINCVHKDYIFYIINCVQISDTPTNMPEQAVLNSHILIHDNSLC